ncbi:unnamed protein product [Adineta steineri]|uniref:Arrestin C-terminal-like domain-containing protein n=1 Tax=Adineta steineri TaxID=433720 RepID=A0A814N752_9BILA|nr:unnamed protein product [Adineta steineri]CAF1089536.1 unnamed protein product [Adineta steineri]CAF3970141.1 unnamed protein product [Adineta steineri]
MGCGSSNKITIIINLDRNNSFYYTGEYVNGNVQLNIMDGELAASEICIKLIGEIGYTTSRTGSDGRGHTNTQTQYHHIPFYSSEFTIAQSANEQQQLVYDQGKYSWPFQIFLTEDLPPTINDHRSYPRVRYYLQVIIDKISYRSNTRETPYLNIYPRVNLLQNPQCLISTTFDNKNKKDVILKGTLNKSGLIPGESITGTLEIENLRKVLIKCIYVTLFQNYEIGSDSRRLKIFETTLPEIANVKNEQIREPFSITFPPHILPPSYKFNGGVQAIVNVHIHYLIKFEVIVEGIFCDFHVDIPIILGTEPNPDPYPDQQQIFNSLNTPDVPNYEQSEFKDNDPPPDYDSVVLNVE